MEALVAPVIAPDVAPAAAVEQAPAAVEAAPDLKHHSETPTILGEAKFDDPPKPEDKPAEAAKPEETKAEDAKPEDPAKPVENVREPIAYELAVPEGITVAPEGLARATDTFNKLGLSQEQAATAWAAYTDEVKAMEGRTSQRQNDAFMAMREGWKERFTGDALIGQPAAMKAILRTRDSLVPDGDRKEFNEMIALTGAGDHPALARMIYRAHERIESLEAQLREGPAPSPHIRPVPVSLIDPAQKGARILYDEPVSGGRS